ncbi:MAG: hypothetical protein JEZ03_08840 [Bacteroidales bacterium]|nr:hypothetical protein [Bacteroidales bacterium]
METKLAKVISYLFHPLLIPTYTITLFFILDVYFVTRIPVNVRIALSSIVFLSTFIMPIILILGLKRVGIIKDIHMHNRNERRIPLLAMIIFYSFTFYLLNNMQWTRQFNLFALGGCLLTIIALIVNSYWKISLHMIGNGAMFGLFLGLSFVGVPISFFYLSFLTVILGMVGFARLKLNAHNQAQIYSGLITGASVMITLIYFLA